MKEKVTKKISSSSFDENTEERLIFQYSFVYLKRKFVFGIIIYFNVDPPFVILMTLG